MDTLVLESLRQTAAQLCHPGYGILAADESVSTVGKRLEAHGLENDAETRRRYRSMLMSSPELSAHCSGVILFHETFYQRPDLDLNAEENEEETFASYLTSQGILPGIKVDTGLRPVDSSPTETYTSGLEDQEAFAQKLQQYADDGALFCKWRAALRIDEEKHLPSDSVIDQNAVQLATYAQLALMAKLVPIIEPEVLIDGVHDGETAAAVSCKVIKRVYEELDALNVPLECTLLKPMMIVPGIHYADRSNSSDIDPEVVAKRTLDVMKECVPFKVPGIMFLSGGMSEKEATVCLNALNKLKAQEEEQEGEQGEGEKKEYWNLSFSFGRALQSCALKTWKGNDENRMKCGQIVADVIKANGLATLHEFDGNHPTELVEDADVSDNLYEGFRGWREKNDLKGI